MFYFILFYFILFYLYDQIPLFSTINKSMKLIMRFVLVIDAHYRLSRCLPFLITFHLLLF